MEHSFFLTNAISTEMTIFGSNDRDRKPHDHRRLDDRKCIGRNDRVCFSRSLIFSMIMRVYQDGEGVM